MIRILALARAAADRAESVAYARGYAHGCAGMVSLAWACDPSESAAYARGYRAGVAAANGGV